MTYTIRIKGSDVSFPAEPGERILKAAERAGIELPHACGSGFCGACSAKVASGSFLAYAPGSSEGRPASGPNILCCSSSALSDAEIEIAWKRLVAASDMKVESCERLAPDVIRVVLRPAGAPVVFTPGQFVDIVQGDERRSYSIACDNVAGVIELHIRHVKGGRFTDRFFGVTASPLKAGDTLRVTAPSGEFRLHKRTDHDLAFLMTGTGFAPAKAMIENYIRLPAAKPHQVYLYWGGRTKADLYMDELCRRWEREHDWFHYCPVLSREADWDGRRGHVQDAFLADHPDASGFDAYMCGSGRLVADATAALKAAGIAPDRIYSDAFTAG